MFNLPVRLPVILSLDEASHFKAMKKLLVNINIYPNFNDQRQEIIFNRGQAIEFFRKVGGPKRSTRLTNLGLGVVLDSIARAIFKQQQAVEMMMRDFYPKVENYDNITFYPSPAFVKCQNPRTLGSNAVAYPTGDQADTTGYYDMANSFSLPRRMK